MSTALSVLAALVLLSILVSIHELGHFLMGRKLGFTILEFAVGMGPVLYKKTKNGVDYTLRAFPIGGICRFYGEDEAATDGKSFSAHPVWKRILVILAGPVMNLLSALLLSALVFSVYGNYVPSVVELNDPSSPAAVASVVPGDIIAAVNGTKIHEYYEAVPLIQSAQADSLTVTVDRDGRLMDLHLADTYDETLGYSRIGVTIEAVRIRYAPAEIVGESFYYMGSVVKQTFGFFGTLFRGQAESTDVAGPVGTIAFVSQAVRYGWETILRLAILISISLGIFNLLPIPALDGGRLAFLLVEAVTGKAIPPEKEGLVHFVGLILLFGLIIFLTFNDISNIIGG